MIDWPDRDEEFTYDDLDRVTESARGVRVDPTTFTYAPNSQEWDLDMLGNWDSVWTDADTAGIYATEELRTHNEANEITLRDPDGAGGDPALALAFDDSGNITTQDQTGSAPQIMYIHDGWNRLVEVQYGAGATRGRYEYNGLGWRITKEADVHGATASDPPDGVLDEDRRFYYSFGWKLLQEDIDDDLDGTLDHRAQTFWGLRGGDDVVMRRRDANLDGVYENSYYHLTDDQFSTIALIGASGSLIERISYDPYGEARHHRMADLNGDGATGVADQLIQLGNWGAYGAGDLDRNGIVGNSDWLLLLGDWGGALPAGQLTNPGVDNHFGYAGYVFNAESQLYVVRFRWYAPDLGRFLERDPAGYTDGMLLYLYAGNNPVIYVDPMGLRLRWYDRALRWAGNFGGGAGDSISFGATAKLRQWTGVDSGPIKGTYTNSAAYTQGQWTSTVATAVTPKGVATGVVKAANALKGAATGAKGAAAAKGAAGAAAATAARGASQARGQIHHAISKRVHKALEDHPNLAGKYKTRDPRFTAQATDKAGHKGYQKWHRELDDEVDVWLRDPKNKTATPEQFEEYLGELYNRPEIAKRFGSNPCISEN